MNEIVKIIKDIESNKIQHLSFNKNSIIKTLLIDEKYGGEKFKDSEEYEMFQQYDQYEYVRIMDRDKEDKFIELSKTLYDGEGLNNKTVKSLQNNNIKLFPLTYSNKGLILGAVTKRGLLIFNRQ